MIVIQYFNRKMENVTGFTEISKVLSENSMHLRIKIRTDIFVNMSEIILFVVQGK